MKRIISTIALLITLGATLYAQLPSFEWRLENEQLTAANTYQFDVNLYNTGSSAFELRAGTIAFLVNSSWVNGGTLTVTTPSSGLVSGQQGSAASFSATAPSYFRKIITSVGAGSGTNIPAGSKVKCFTIQLANTANFSTTATPNFAWKFTTTSPSAGFNFTDGTGNQTGAVSNIVGSAAAANQVFCYTPTYWTGSAWNTGSQTAGAASTSAPNASQDVVIYNNYINTTYLSVRGLVLFDSIVNGIGTIYIYGNITFYKDSKISQGGGIYLNGTGQNANQLISGNGAIECFHFHFGGGGTKTIKTPLVLGFLYQESPSNLYFDTTGAYFNQVRLHLSHQLIGQNFPLSIGQLSSGTSISSNINDYLWVETLIPDNGRRWRFLSSPVVGGSTLQWRDYARNTAGIGIQITGSTGIVDSSRLNQSSAYWYDESSSLGGANINSKWTAIDGNSNLVNGKGYRVFVRGDRTIPLSTMNNINNQTIIYVKGSYPSTPVNIPLTYNQGFGNGWNLVGNPLPSVIDWDATSGLTKTNISNTIWIWNPINNSYGSYDGITSVNSVGRYISTGQGFFVKAMGLNPALLIDEGAKTFNFGTSTPMFKAASKNTLKIILKKDATESDETVVRFMDTKSDEFNGTDDVEKPMMNPAVNISSYFGTDKYAMVNYMNTKSMDAKVIPLGASVTETGTYDLNFDQVDGFDANINIYLKDNYNNSITDLRQNSKYAFNVDSKPESTMDGRLELIFVNKTSSIESVLAGRTANMNVYPNPAVDLLNVEITNANFKQSEVSIFSVSGVEVMNNNMMGNKKSLDIQKLSSGVYFVRVSNTETGFVNTAKFVK